MKKENDEILAFAAFNGRLIGLDPFWFHPAKEGSIENLKKKSTRKKRK